MKQVLVVDDTKSIRMLLSTCLQIEGYKVITARDGYTALNLFDREIFDLAFLDIKMPELSGTEVLRRIRNKAITTPVIIMTAFGTVKNAVECTKMGAVEYLKKPFTAERIKDILKEMGISNIDNGFNNEFDKMIEDIKIYIKQQQYITAIELLKKAISLRPSDYRVYKLFSIAYKCIGNLNEAAKFYNAFKEFKK
ncbi:response regulator [Aceticella autotrophica]|uniref:Stage 0 sporulation protein A homolog n=1 Tax=Aceticella autotrophica TaxID=2755338 RepID=A0A975AW37_9THEO|nr:response regulator [Aceticella autotrophica]QSZ27525.1 response regulator [Aceticella autotrophica]